ncbi:hypothetical protein AZI86_12515 [Bdellovibrio bacteriovorus]|uniref:Uncharacterized protein n=1 Tax=Bdellovibrio bacteriovorus TaxID=959 RepID=A0A150WIN0_BDEBC|nr:hypothetical protein AZI86_12515 [Bdellovibrio bacteriovorus]
MREALKSIAHPPTERFPSISKEAEAVFGSTRDKPHMLDIGAIWIGQILHRTDIGITAVFIEYSNWRPLQE